jgi:hypothetical protein
VRLYEPHAQAVRARRQHDFICGGEYLGPSHSRSGQGTEEHTWASARSNALTHKHTLTHTPTCTHAHGHAGCSNKMRHRMQRNVPHHAISRAQRAAVCLRPQEHASCDVARNARPFAGCIACVTRRISCALQVRTGGAHTCLPMCTRLGRDTSLGNRKGTETARRGPTPPTPGIQRTPYTWHTTYTTPY